MAHDGGHRSAREEVRPRHRAVPQVPQVQQELRQSLGAHRAGVRVGAELRGGWGELRQGLAVLRGVQSRGGVQTRVVPPQVEEDGGLHRRVQKSAARTPRLPEDTEGYPAEGCGRSEALTGRGLVIQILNISANLKVINRARRRCCTRTCSRLPFLFGRPRRLRESRRPVCPRSTPHPRRRNRPARAPSPSRSSAPDSTTRPAPSTSASAKAPPLGPSVPRRLAVSVLVCRGNTPARGRPSCTRIPAWHPRTARRT